MPAISLPPTSPAGLALSLPTTVSNPAVGGLLTSAAPDATAHRREQADERAARRRERHEEFAAELAAQPSAADRLRTAEQRVEPGSHAYRQQVRESQQRDGRRPDGPSFRRELSHAERQGQPDRTTATPRSTSNASRPADSGDGGKSTPTLRSADANAASVAQPRALPAGGAATHAPAATSNASAHQFSGANPAAAKLAAQAQSSQRTASVTNSTSSHAAAAARASAATNAARSPGATTTAPVVSTAGTRAATPAAMRTSSASAPEPGRNDANIERILRFIHSRIDRAHTSATLRLDPPNLGTIRIYMDLRESELSLRLDPQTELAHRLLSEGVESLRQGLSAAGIQLDRLDIRPPPPPQAPGDTDTSPQPHDHATDGQSPSSRDDSDTALGGSGPATGTGSPGPRSAEDDAGQVSPAISGLTGTGTSPAAEPRVDILA